MTNTENTNAADPGDDVMKAIGSLSTTSADLKEQTASGGDFTADEAVGILTIIGKAILNIFGK